MAHATLPELIAAFAGRPDVLACLDPVTAFGACGPVSRRFAAAARATGLSARIVRMSRWADDGVAERVLLHDVAVIEDIVVDWSARQFVDQVVFDGRTPALGNIQVPCVIRLDADGIWPPEAFARGGVEIWDEAYEIVAPDAPLGPDLEARTADWNHIRDAALG